MNVQDKVLNKIKNDFQLMTKMVLSQLAINKRLLSENVSEKVLAELKDEVERNEGLIDSIEVKLRSEMITTIVLYAPRASDLRKIIAYYDMTTNLERIGDQLHNICKFIHSIDKKGVVYANFKEKIEKMFFVVENMTQNAIFAFLCEDMVLARQTIHDDDMADDLNKQINKDLKVPFIKGEVTSAHLSDLMIINSLAYNLERIGDNATNIAESAIYLTEGKDIKHNKE